MKVTGHPYGPPADMDPETAICMRKIFEALEDARLRLDSDTSNLEHLRAAKQKERNELMKSGVTVYDGPFEVDEAMLLRPEFVVRHLLTTADIPELNHPMGSQGGLPAEEPHTWVDEHGDGYDPEKQNALNDDDAFEVPFVGYAKKDLHWRQPAEPEQNVLDYLPTGKFSQPKSMKLRNLLGPYPEPKNVWGGPGHEITLDY